MPSHSGIHDGRVQSEPSAASTEGRADGGDDRSRRRLLAYLPLLAFGGLAGALYWGLNRDPSVLSSALVGRPVPEFTLPPLFAGAPGLSSKDLYGQVSLVNVFASWCVPCREEHPQLLRLASERIVPLYGINYKDAPDDARQWLGSLGSPYDRIGADRSGRVAIEWGVYGVPETYIVGADGVIAYRHVGPLRASGFAQTILPKIERLRAGQSV